MWDAYLETHFKLDHKNQSLLSISGRYAILSDSGETGIIVLYPFMTLPDDTEIVHSQNIVKAGNEAVKVVGERPVDYGCISAGFRIIAGNR